jgi:hypothetical protein
MAYMLGFDIASPSYVTRRSPLDYLPIGQTGEYHVGHPPMRQIEGGLGR